MQNIAKALQELEEAVKESDTVKRVTVTVTIQKSKPSKAEPESK